MVGVDSVDADAMIININKAILDAEAINLEVFHTFDKALLYIVKNIINLCKNQNNVTLLTLLLWLDDLCPFLYLIVVPDILRWEFILFESLISNYVIRSLIVMHMLFYLINSSTF